MATKKYLDYAGLKRVLAKLLPGARKIWHGTQAEWDALSAAERDKYDQAEIIDSTAEIYHIKPDWAGAVAVSAAQLYAGYTVPSDGMIVGVIRPVSGSNITIDLTINNIFVARGGEFTATGWDGCVQCPVCANDVVKISASQLTTTLYFVPWAN